MISIGLVIEETEQGVVVRFDHRPEPATIAEVHMAENIKAWISAGMTELGRQPGIEHVIKCERKSTIEPLPGSE